MERKPWEWFVKLCTMISTISHEAVPLKEKMPEVRSINPYTGTPIKTYTTHSVAEVDKLIEIASDRFSLWRDLSISGRAEFIEKVRLELLKNRERYAHIMTEEMGKPIAQSIAEIEKCAWLCEYYRDQAEVQLAPEEILTDADFSYITYEPLGVILAVMPWNYPFWQVFRFAIPALMAGNVTLLKHASNVFGSALAIQEIFQRAGLPEGCFTTLLIKNDMVGYVIEKPQVKAVSLTGSGPAGASVASAAAKKIKKSLLELGGNNALIVLSDCDLERTVRTCIQARFQNTGQSCIAGKRLLVQASIYDTFIENLLKATKELKSGDPKDKSTFIGTLAREDLAVELEQQVLKSVEQGAKIAIGGKRCEAYFEPTIVVGVSPDMPMFQEETFGPALGVTQFNDLEEAIALSNNSKYGLGVSIFTANVDAVKNYISRFEEGAVFVNELVKSDPRLPFGGVKESGFGRELSALGIREFVNVKTVYLKK